MNGNNRSAFFRMLEKSVFGQTARFL